MELSFLAMETEKEHDHCAHRRETDQEPRMCTAFQRPRTETLSPQDHWIRERCVIQCHCCCFITKSCPTLCNPTDCGPPGSPALGILRARILEPFPSPGDLPDPGIEPKSPVLAGRFFLLLSHLGSPVLGDITAAIESLFQCECF